jgi:L-rhamnose isomerase
MGSIEKAYESARERYAELGVDTAAAITGLRGLSLSLPCWQGDDLAGAESLGGGVSTSGMLVTGAHPGAARDMDELRQDLTRVYSLVPGRHRLQVQMRYGDFGGKAVDRDQIEPAHFAAWVDWAKSTGIKLDANASIEIHPRAEVATLSHPDGATRDFWIEHARRSRLVAAYFGREFASAAVHNIWIPDGSKEYPFDSLAPRRRLKESLDEIFSLELPDDEMCDSIEGKLFGIGSESYVVGSHEFYLGYAVANGKMLTVDNGHYHPTESVADKLSALSLFLDRFMLHLTRGIRWDSDHVPLLNDELQSICAQLVRCGLLGRAHLALDFFDAGINRVGAYVMGTCAVLKALLLSMLEPSKLLADAEAAGDSFSRMAIAEQAKTMPFGAVWEYYCETEGVPAGTALIDEVLAYEREVLSERK